MAVENLAAGKKRMARSLKHNQEMEQNLLSEHLKEFLDLDNIFKQKTFPYIKHMTDLTTVLPCLQKESPEVRKTVLNGLVEGDIQQSLERSGTLNWWKGMPFLPMKTTSDGNCLLHAAALYMWGTEDAHLQLRSYLHYVMNHEVFGRLIKRHWIYQKSHETYQQTPEQQDLEWSQIVEASNCSSDFPTTPGLPYPSLEEIHIFTLANILARPIVIISQKTVHSLKGEALQADTVGGIYLPLLLEPGVVYRSPIVLTYHMNHFMPLVGAASSISGPPTEAFVPLVRKDLTPMKIHFLLAAQRMEEYKCLQEYMWLSEELQTDDIYCNKYLVAKLQLNKIDEILDIPLEYVKTVRKWHKRKLGESSVKSQRCKTVGCSFYCTPETGAFCSRCLKKFKDTSYSQEQIEYYENAERLQGARANHDRDPLHIGEHRSPSDDDYLEPLVTTPSHCQQDKAVYMPTGCKNTNNSIAEERIYHSLIPCEPSIPNPPYGNIPQVFMTEQHLDPLKMPDFSTQLNLEEKKNPEERVKSQMEPPMAPKKTEIHHAQKVADIRRKYGGGGGPLGETYYRQLQQAAGNEDLTLRIEPGSGGRSAPHIPVNKSEESFISPLCRYPGCTRHGDVNFSWLCGNHYKREINKRHVQNYSEKGKHTTNGSEGNSGSHSPRPGLTRLAATQLSEGHSGFESQRHHIYQSSQQSHLSQGPTVASEKHCHHHSHATQSSPHSKQENPLFDSSYKNLTDVERKIKQEVKLCVTPNCPHYGNPKKQHYCNACFETKCKRMI